jgi:hypothetical protein
MNDTTEQILPQSWQQVFALISLAGSPREFKKRLHALARAIGEADAAQKKLAEDRAQYEAQLAKDCAELEQDRAAVTKRRVDVEVAEGRLAERKQRYVEMQKAWGDLKLPGDTFAAFGGLTRAPLHTPLEIARFATEHGRLPDADEVVTLREDAQGNEFPASTTITRQSEQSEPPAAGARVRPSRRVGA